MILHKSAGDYPASPDPARAEERPNYFSGRGVFD